MARALLLLGSGAACASYIAFLYSVTPGTPGFGKVFLRGGFVALIAAVCFLFAIFASRETLSEISRLLMFRRKSE